MGYTTYTFAATRAEVESQSFVLPVAQLFPTARERHVGVEQLVVLAALLSGRDLAKLTQEQERGSILVFARVASRWFPMARDLGAEWGYQPGDYPLVLQVPDGFTTLLAQIPGEQVARYAKAWAATPWWGLDGALPARQEARISLYLRDLTRLAAHVCREGKALYLWAGEE